MDCRRQAREAFASHRRVDRSLVGRRRATIVLPLRQQRFWRGRVRRDCAAGALGSEGLRARRREGEGSGARPFKVLLQVRFSPLRSLFPFDLTPSSRSGAIGSGLAILSRYPITAAFVSPYPLNGFPLHFIEGDFFAGKSACGITIEVPGVGRVDCLNTHMYAPGGEGDSVTGAHRVAQAWELARLAVEKSERGRHVIVVRCLYVLASPVFRHGLPGRLSVSNNFTVCKPRLTLFSPRADGRPQLAAT